jgi:hypothetical protein
MKGGKNLEKDPIRFLGKGLTLETIDYLVGNISINIKGKCFAIISM